MIRFINKETGKFLVSSAPIVPRPYPCKDYRFCWSRNGHFYRSEKAINRTIKRLNSENIPFDIVIYDENTIGVAIVKTELKG